MGKKKVLNEFSKYISDHMEIFTRYELSCYSCWITYLKHTEIFVTQFKSSKFYTKEEICNKVHWSLLTYDV